MLPKFQRLNLKKDFKFVQAGKRSETPSLRLMFRLGENEHPLVGIALSKRDFKLATDRNRAKRLVSTAIQPLYPRLQKSINLVIMPKGKILDKKAEEVKDELSVVKSLYQSD